VFLDPAFGEDRLPVGNRARVLRLDRWEVGHGALARPRRRLVCHDWGLSFPGDGWSAQCLSMRCCVPPSVMPGGEHRRPSLVLPGPPRTHRRHHSGSAAVSRSSWSWSTSRCETVDWS
jgi:hypothetical protein